MTAMLDPEQGKPQPEFPEARANLAYALAAAAQQGRLPRRVRLAHYDQSYMIDLTGTEDDEDLAAMNGAAQAILDTEGWPICEIGERFSRRLINIQNTGTQFDMLVKCGAPGGEPNLFINLPILPQYMDTNALEKCLLECFRHMMRKNEHPAELAEHAGGFAYDLKFTHPTARYLRRLRAGLCDPHIQTLLTRIRSSVKENRPFGRAAVIGLGDGLASLIPHMPPGDITLICPSQTAARIEANRFDGLRTKVGQIVNGTAINAGATPVDLALCTDFLQGNCTGFPSALATLSQLVRPGGWIILSIRRLRQYLSLQGRLAEQPSAAAHTQTRMLHAMLTSSPYFSDITLLTAPQAAPDDFFLARRAQS